MEKTKYADDSVRCPTCKIKVQVEVWDDGKCPQCDTPYEWRDIPTVVWGEAPKLRCASVGGLHQTQCILIAGHEEEHLGSGDRWPR